MEKTIIIDGRPVRFRATAAVPRLYRIKFRRDILKDMLKLKTAHLKAVDPEMTEEEKTEAGFQVTDLEIFENCAYIMARHGDPENTPKDVGAWLDQFETFSIYQVLPEILELWALNEETQVESKKKLAQAAGS